MNCPLDYSLCDQTVTLYRRRGEVIFRQVVENALYRHTLRQVSDQLGTRLEGLFTLIIPGDAQLQPGDRVMAGVGPETVDWSSFVPSAVAGLCQVAYVTPRCWQGEICHTEAGRK